MAPIRYGSFLPWLPALPAISEPSQSPDDMRPRRTDRRTEPRPAGPPGFAARRAAAELVEGVLRHNRRLSDQTGEGGPLARLGPADRARAQALAATVLRHLPAIDRVLDAFLRRRPAARALTALRLAAAEMLVDGVPPHAATDAAVTLTRGHPKSRHLAPLVNAVARRLAAEGPARWAEIPPRRLPPWLEAPVVAAWGEAAADTIAQVQGGRPPIDLTPKAPDEAESLADRLGGDLLPTGSIRLAPRVQVSTLPGYEEGEWWVQDAAAALPAQMLGIRPGERVLDLCAAPGGKTLQLAASGGLVTALDISTPRLGRLHENLARTGLEAEIVVADALAWTPDAAFGAILIDAPCSATGTIRRHPDLPHLRSAGDIAPLLTLQAALLDRAWTWLRPGGRLVYAVCSLLPAEGEEQVAAFLQRSPGAQRLRPDLALPEGWLDAEGALRTRPDFWAESGGVDGFHAALIGKA